MTKFIACEDGTYVNLIEVFYFCVVPYRNLKDEIESYDIIVSCSSRTPKYLIRKLKDQEEAQEWLDNCMIKHGLCVEPTTPNRCF